mgnify:CR=1 FL=1|jgi:hypothetical protein
MIKIWYNIGVIFMLWISSTSALSFENIITAASKIQEEEISDKCIGLVKNFESLTLNMRSLLDAFRSSGHDYNDFGKFNHCVDNPGTHYLLVTCKEERCGDRFPIEMSFGVCMPI